MLRSAIIALAGFGLLLTTALPGAAQLPVQDWTVRPDDRAPAGTRGDAILPRGTLDLRVHASFLKHNNLLVGTDEYPAELVVSGQDVRWDMAPLSMTTQRYEFEAHAGLLDWLGATARLPVTVRSAEFMTTNRWGDVSNTGVGDLEVLALLGIHDAWPYRAHLTAGVSFPTGAAENRGELPNDPGQSQLLPYGLQPGDGTFALLPGAVFVAENQFGTVGFQAEARFPLGENDHGWTRGNEMRGNLWMAYRFTDHVSGSVRLTYHRTDEISGFDPRLDPWASPMHLPEMNGGTRVGLPVGMNVIFPMDGRLPGHRLSAEFLMPVHEDLNGPQLGTDLGFAVSWSYQPLGRERTQRPVRATIIRDTVVVERRVEEELPAGTPMQICLATGENATIYMTPEGDTLVGDRRVSVRELGPSVAFAGEYAENRPWFTNDEPIRFETREYRRVGGDQTLDCADIVQVAIFQGVPVFARRDSVSPHETLYVPVRPGIWQAYDIEPTAVRG